MGVDHRRADIPVSQELLDRPDVVAVFEEMGGEGMARGGARQVRPRPEPQDGEGVADGSAGSDS
jgi:hypothetical protein